MSALGREMTLDQEHIEATAPRTLRRIRGWLRRKGHRVQGDMFIHALEALVKPEPEPPLDAGWPAINPVTGKAHP